MRRLLATLATLTLAACAGAPDPAPTDTITTSTLPPGSLPDRVAYLQTDPRWAADRLGNSSDTMGSDGCLVTAVAMAVTNRGVPLDPDHLNRRLRAADAFTPRGWLIWSGVSDATEGRATAIYHDSVSPALIRQCMADGAYPLVRFILPNGRSHWAMIVAEDANGHYRMRDPLRASRSPLIFPRGADAFKSLRCVGLA